MRRYFQLSDVTAYLIKVGPGYAPEEVKATIDRLYGMRRHLTVELNRSLKLRAGQLMAQAFSLFDVLALIAVIVAALGVVNTLTMNVLERTREIGMLRSLGMTRWQVGKMILAESMLMGLIGGVFGLLFGLFLSRLFLRAVTAMQGYQLGYVVPTQGIVISLLIALVVSHLAAIWPARRAARIRIIEAMQYE
jgi:putative ABC transport system permease protein